MRAGEGVEKVKLGSIREQKDTSEMDDPAASTHGLALEAQQCPFTSREFARCFPREQKRLS